MEINLNFLESLFGEEFYISKIFVKAKSVQYKKIIIIEQISKVFLSIDYSEEIKKQMFEKLLNWAQDCYL